MMLGGMVVTLVFMGSVWAAENKAVIKNFKKQNPTLFVFVVMLASYFLMSLFGGVMVFIFGISFPLMCKSATGERVYQTHLQSHSALWDACLFMLVYLKYIEIDLDVCFRLCAVS